MKIQFIGAAREVTGSCTLLQAGGKNYLVDCGMEQGIDVFQNVPLPVSPREIDAVFLTHAHIDHSGMLPRLYKDGFRGSIYATAATVQLSDIMLRDSAHIQMLEAEWRSRRAARKGEEYEGATYDVEDAAGAVTLMVPCRYGERMQIDGTVAIRFTDIGHLLGSASIEIWLTEGGESRKIVFSGDVGNKNQAIIKDPSRVNDTDYLVIESTYGNRSHGERGDSVGNLSKVIERTLSRGGNLVIPAFAVGRTQEMLYAIREIKEKHLVKDVSFPVYVDSPLAIEATHIFNTCDRSCFDEETLAILARGGNPLGFPELKLAITPDESKQINFDKTPKVIISASGMCEAGRVRHHLKHNLWRPQCTVLFVGYQAVGSLGRELEEGAKHVRLFGEEIAVKAEITSLHGVSGHADREGLLEFVEGFREKPRKIFVNHGDEQSALDFSETLKERGYVAEAPYSGTEYDLLTGEMTAYTEQKRVAHNNAAATRARARKESVHRDLVAAAESLLALARAAAGKPNKENAAFAAQIRNLTKKWED